MCATQFSRLLAKAEAINAQDTWRKRGLDNG